MKHLFIKLKQEENQSVKKPSLVSSLCRLSAELPAPGFGIYKSFGSLRAERRGGKEELSLCLKFQESPLNDRYFSKKRMLIIFKPNNINNNFPSDKFMSSFYDGIFLFCSF